MLTITRDEVIYLIKAVSVNIVELIWIWKALIFSEPRWVVEWWYLPKSGCWFLFAGPFTTMYVFFKEIVGQDILAYNILMIVYLDALSSKFWKFFWETYHLIHISSYWYKVITKYYMIYSHVFYPAITRIGRLIKTFQARPPYTKPNTLTEKLQR